MNPHTRVTPQHLCLLPPQYICVLLLVFARPSAPRPREVAAIALAFSFAECGDYFLAEVDGHADYFITGVACNFFAHLGYISYSLMQGRPGRIHACVLAASLCVLAPYFGILIVPVLAPQGGAMIASCLLYMLVSCVSLACAIGAPLRGTPRVLYGLGIFIAVLSDTFISLAQFLGVGGVGAVVLPTYYLCQGCVTASLLERRELRPAGAQTCVMACKLPR